VKSCIESGEMTISIWHGGENNRRGGYRSSRKSGAPAKMAAKRSNLKAAWR